MPTAETLALALEIAERDVKRARVQAAEAECQTIRYIRECGELQAALHTARAHLAAIAVSRARRDKRRAGKLAAARIRFLCPGGPVPVPPDRKPEGGGL